MMNQEKVTVFQMARLQVIKRKQHHLPRASQSPRTATLLRTMTALKYISYEGHASHPHQQLSPSPTFFCISSAKFLIARSRLNPYLSPLFIRFRFVRLILNSVNWGMSFVFHNKFAKVCLVCHQKNWILPILCVHWNESKTIFLTFDLH